MAAWGGMSISRARLQDLHGEQVGRGRSGFDALNYQKVLTGDLPGSKKSSDPNRHRQVCLGRIPLGQLRDEDALQGRALPDADGRHRQELKFGFLQAGHSRLELDVERSVFANMR